MECARPGLRKYAVLNSDAFVVSPGIHAAIELRKLNQKVDCEMCSINAVAGAAREILKILVYASVFQRTSIGEHRIFAVFCPCSMVNSLALSSWSVESLISLSTPSHRILLDINYAFIVMKE